jgi:ribosomal subunit interface protein
VDTSPEITFHNVPSSEALRGLIEKRIARMERFHHHIVSCRVVVGIDRRAPQSVKLPVSIAVEVDVPGRSKIVAREEEERHEAKGDGQAAAVNRAFEEVERRLEEDARVRNREVKAHPRGDIGGMVVRLFPDESYGFVEIGGSPDLYFAREVVEGDGFDALKVGEAVRVRLAEAEGPMGPQASKVTPRRRRHAE